MLAAPAPERLHAAFRHVGSVGMDPRAQIEKLTTHLPEEGKSRASKLLEELRALEGQVQ